MPALQRAFDEAAEGGRLLRIPKLELDLTVDAEAQLKELLPDLILQQVREKLRPYLPRPESRSDKVLSPEDPPFATSRFDALIHYLDSGFLPWENSLAPPSEIAAALEETCRKQWMQLVAFIREKQPGAPWFFRLLRIVGEERITPLINDISTGTAKVGGLSAVEAVALLLNDRKLHFSRQTRMKLAAAIISKCGGWRKEYATDSISAAIAGTIVTPQEAGVLAEFVSLLREAAACRAERRESTAPREPDGADADDFPKIKGATEEGTMAEWREGHSPREREKSGKAGSRDCKETASGTIVAPQEAEVSAGSVSLSGEVAACSVERRKSRISRDSGDYASTIFREAKMITASVELERYKGPSSRKGEKRGKAAPRSGKETAFSIAGVQHIPAEWGDVRPAPGPFPTDTAAEFSRELFPLAVRQSGLILLHPFVPQLFAATGTTAPAGPPLLADPARAAAILHFCATGDEEVYEFELGLTKVLLGLEPEMPLSVCEGLLGQQDREEGEALLRSVVTHWSVLKSTSVDGFRSAFLQRRGMLHREEYGWKLNVERGPFDMLLDYLPWSIGIVRLPWMKKPVYVEW